MVNFSLFPTRTEQILTVPLLEIINPAGSHFKVMLNNYFWMIRVLSLSSAGTKCRIIVKSSGFDLDNFTFKTRQTKAKDSNASDKNS